MRSIGLLSLAASAAVAATVPGLGLNLGNVAAATGSAPITNTSQMVSALQGIIDDGKDLAMGAQEILGVLNAIVPIASPQSIPEALERLAQIYSKNYKNLFVNGGEILLNGLAPGDATAISNSQTAYNGYNNTGNPQVSGIYPKSAQDAPYDIPEANLREAVYIPPGFTWGKVRPLIFVPGTGVFAGQNFAQNAGKLFAGSSFADPVYLNIPGAQLNDIQTNAEYIAYASNYVAALTRRNVSLMSWSAGAPGVRWANKYWPSTRAVSQNAVAISGDFHGTTLAYMLDPQYPRGTGAPAVVQQEYNSTFMATLRNNGGDSPFYPLTTVFSAFDEIVEPQGGTGVSRASGYSNDANGAPVTNIYLQGHCPALTPGGAVYNSHEGVLYNALALAATKDALVHGGAADLSRIDVAAECLKFAADGLSLSDILATEATIPIAGIGLVEYKHNVGPEPTIKPYAVKDIPAGYCNGC